jgi:hypothetical protein
MSKKLEKLKEVNVMLNAVLMELETRIFIDNISDVKEKMTKDEKPKVMVEIKQ